MFEDKFQAAFIQRSVSLMEELIDIINEQFSSLREDISSLRDAIASLHSGIVGISGVPSNNPMDLTGNSADNKEEHY